MQPESTQPHEGLIVTEGFPDSDRPEIARLYWSAFGRKLGFALSPPDKAVAMLAETLAPGWSIVVRHGEGRLLGVAGYKTAQGAFTAITFEHLRAHFGLFGAFWRGTVLSLLDRKPEAGTLLMDGIFVAEHARGKGVGTLLLKAVKAKARGLGCSQVRLDVIDTNPRARQLYEREGFRAVATEDLGPLRHIFGFTRATTMTAPA